MPELMHLQNSFAFGQFGEIALADVDLGEYYKAARELTNAMVVPQGPAQKRFGTKFVDSLLVETDPNTVHMNDMSYLGTESYLFVFTPSSLFIYHDDILIQSLDTPYTAKEMIELSTQQLPKDLVVFAQTIKTKLLQRLVSLGNWNASTNTPALVSSVGNKGDLYLVSVAGTTDLDGTDTWSIGDWVHYDGTKWEKLITQDNELPWVLNEAPYKFFPVFDFKKGTYDNSVFLPGAVSGSDVTLTITQAPFIFDESYVGGQFVGDGGRMRLTEFVSTSVMKGDILTRFIGDLPGTAAVDIKGVNSFLGEPAFSDIRGWPRSAFFFQQRLFYLGTSELPDGVFSSVINDFFNLDPGVGNPSDGIADILVSEKAAIIKHGIGANTVLIFTIDGVFYARLNEEAPLTPSNAGFLRGSPFGSADVKPVFLENFAIFVDKGGKVIRAVSYVNDTSSMEETNLSIAIPDLVKTPRQLALFKNSTNGDSVYLIVINEDGTALSFQLNKKQNISAWTPLVTEGEFLDVVSLNEEVYFLVKRDDKLLLEKLDFNTFLDSYSQYNFMSPTTMVTGLSYLEGKTVAAVVDGAIELDLVVENGQIELTNAGTNVVVGLRYTMRIIPMPLNFNLPTGPDLYEQKRIKRVFVDFFESAGIKVNGYQLPNYKFSNTNFIEEIQPQSGVDQVFIGKGFEPRAVQVEITHDLPLPCTIRGLGMEVSL